MVHLEVEGAHAVTRDAVASCDRTVALWTAQLRGLLREATPSGAVVRDLHT